jgi:hypothetical protein
MQPCQITGQMLPADQIVKLHGYGAGPEGNQILLDRMAVGGSLRSIRNCIISAWGAAS